jgi:hypothetical protein
MGMVWHIFFYGFLYRWISFGVCLHRRTLTLSRTAFRLARPHALMKSMAVHRNSVQKHRPQLRTTAVKRKEAFQVDVPGSMGLSILSTA